MYVPYEDIVVPLCHLHSCFMTFMNIILSARSSMCLKQNC